MTARSLLLHVPVLHRGYLELFARCASTVEALYVFGEEFIREFTPFEADIATLPPEKAQELTRSLNLFANVDILVKEYLETIRGKPLLLINDQFSRRFAEKYLPNADIQWETVFLRWDEAHIAAAQPVKYHTTSTNSIDQQMMAEAYREARLSPDWWRQVGAILLKDGQIRYRAYNVDLPDDHMSYHFGNVRDLVPPGTHRELSNTIHAEQAVIAQAARDGVALKDTKLYVTHFPCSVCAKLITRSGISTCYFSEGSANVDGELVLKTGGVKLVHVPQEGKGEAETNVH